MACAWVAQRTELVDLGDPAWLGDGGMVPVMLACLPALDGRTGRHVFQIL
jgi:hypothetical protein